MDTTSSSLEHANYDSQERGSKSWLTTAATVIVWIELILGLSAISSAVFLNPRVPVLLYALYGTYFGIFLWLLYSFCRSTYLRNGSLPYIYWILGGCTVATVGVVVLTFITAPNSTEIAFIFTIVFVVNLVLLPIISAIFYCFLRGNFTMPKYMSGKAAIHKQKQTVDTVDESHSHYPIESNVHAQVQQFC